MWWYIETCLNWTPLGPAFVFRISMSSVYTGSCINKDFQQWDVFKACIAQDSYLFKVWLRQIYQRNCVSGVIAIMVTLSVVDCGFDPQSGQNKDYKIGNCCLSAEHTALRSKSTDRLAHNQDKCQSGATCLHPDCCLAELVQ
jgi:hypothetical protein